MYIFPKQFKFISQLIILWFWIQTFVEETYKNWTSWNDSQIKVAKLLRQQSYLSPSKWDQQSAIILKYFHSPSERLTIIQSWCFQHKFRRLDFFLTWLLWWCRYSFPCSYQMNPATGIWQTWFFTHTSYKGSI